MEFLLDSLNINTPMCVYIFLSKYIGVSNDIDYYSLDDLSRLLKLIREEFKVDNINDIARFINPNLNVSWKRCKLSEAYKLTTRIIEKGLTSIDHYSVGYQTPENIDSLNDIVLYSLCLRFTVPINYNSTNLEMFEKMNTILYTTESIMERYDTDPIYYMRDDNPTDAIIIAAIVHFKNIYHSIDPVEELKAIRINTIFDERMKYITELNPDMYDTRRYVDINLPRNLYPHFSDIVYSDIKYKSLQNSFKSDYNHYCINTETKIHWDEFTNDCDIVSYGSQITGMIAIIIDELVETFEKEGYLGYCDMVYSDEDIKDLINICISFGRTDIEQRLNYLLDDFIRIKTNLVNIASRYDQEDIRRIFLDILHMGMNMRGWEGIKQYPLDIAIVKDEFITCRRSSASLIILYDLYKIDKLAKEILDLPLLLHSNGEFKFWKRGNDKSIYDRMKIVKENRKDESCIRMSSNYFCSSVYFYVRCIFNEELFNIEKLRFIL